MNDSNKLNFFCLDELNASHAFPDVFTIHPSRLFLVNHVISFSTSLSLFACFLNACSPKLSFLLLLFCSQLSLNACNLHLLIFHPSNFQSSFSKSSTFLASKWPSLSLVPFKGPKKSQAPRTVSILCTGTI
jgi:hypothetical protein